METDIKFEREERSGLIPVGTYLFAAAGRFGIELQCEEFGEHEDCVLHILKGKELLSDFTKLEIEHLSEIGRQNGERLARQAKIEKPGELIIMTKEKVVEEKETTEETQEKYRKEFEELPLEKKIASLMELEAIALGETFNFVMNSPYQIAGKLMDVLAEFGLKFEKEAKEAKVPHEHKNDSASETVTSEKPKDEKKPRSKKAQNN